jgi:hypothetical protein
MIDIDTILMSGFMRRTPEGCALYEGKGLVDRALIEWYCGPNDVVPGWDGTENAPLTIRLHLSLDLTP